ncbi:LysR substrate-binding domain-containing protein [Dyella silvatica]|uniref:LysR substrate-binding domain-containing protein n=1 Tax=Dyella silvatica TaxID=2992128 RepID=UPI00225303CF|nr:LysR substrate-binding domain-containing protein [Dyella silvatica]
MRARPRGRLRVSAPIIYATCTLAPAMSEYLDAYPDVQVELVLNDRVVDLADGGFDAAIRVGVLPDSNLMARPLAFSPRRVCAAPAYLARYGTPQTPQDLQHHHCLAFSGAHGAERDWRFNLADGSQQVVSVPGRLDINGGMALREAALAGLGIILQPEMMVGRDIEAGSLVRLFPDLPALNFPVHIVYLPEHKLTAKLASFVDFMTARFGLRR